MCDFSKSLRFGALQLLSALSLLFLTLDTPAMTASPSPSYDGNYTVSWGTTLGCTYNDDPPFYSYQCYTLYENGAEIGASGYSLQVTGKPEGSYDYYVYYTFYVYGNLYDAYGVESASVTVGTPPPRDSIATQLTYQFETRQGDINYDGRTDLFVQRSSGGVAGNGVLDSVILQQSASGGTFSPVVPDAYSSSIASGWPLSSAAPVITDFNVDGYVDVEVKGVGAATGTSADDQIVFSSGAPLQSQPLGLRAVDASLKQFVANSLDYFVNPNYFEDNALLIPYTGYSWYFFCAPATDFYGIVDYYGGEWYCVNYYDYFSGYYWDYTAFSGEAVVVWSYEEAYEQGSIGQTASTEGAQEAAEEVLGVEIGGWPMEEEFGPTGEHTDADVRRGLESFWAILGIGIANAQEVETEEAPSQVRQPGKIYITSREVVGSWPGGDHTALEYRSFGVPLLWYSAMPENRAGTDRVVSKTNHGADNPSRMMIVGELTPGQYYTGDAFWLEVITPAHLHYRSLPDSELLEYEFRPLNTPWTDYNSNGYLHGLVNWTELFGGSTEFDFNTLVGGETPVPPGNFH